MAVRHAQTTIDGQDLAFEIVQPDISIHESKDCALSYAALQFLATVVEHMNGNLSVDRTHSLAGLRRVAHDAGVDTERLAAEGYVIEHRLGASGNVVAYTPTDKARETVNRPHKHGPARGERGDELPHRYGADLCEQWLYTQDHIVDVVTFVPVVREQDSFVDLIGLGKPKDQLVYSMVIEVKTGMTAGDRPERPPGTDKDSYAADYKDYCVLKRLKQQPMAAADCQAIWIVRDRTVGKRVLRALCHAAKTQIGGETMVGLEVDEVLRRYSEKNLVEFKQDVLDPHAGPGIDWLVTFPEVTEQF